MDGGQQPGPEEQQINQNINENDPVYQAQMKSLADTKKRRKE